jgi:hypothetical protein
MQKYDPQYVPPLMGLIDLVVTIGCSLGSNPKVDNVALVALVVFVLCEEFFHTFYMKMCAHKTHLGVEL